ncbi:helix-turn-helix transcriptional regulator [Saccharothrix sp. HUAS TT1]|uniref:helix-turn-helix transcriptional regulator n=1 Tax=unclassified Saccharothrix TaxID=2593673 RepID=UPI00345BD574
MATRKKTAAGGEEELGQLLSTAEAAPIVGQEPETLRQWRHRGIGPLSFKSGAKVVWPEIPLRRWLADQLAATRKGGTL